jgi:sialic acid synthase SpsE
MKSTVAIGKVNVGDDFPAVFMAEMGTFFNQDVDRAISLVDAAEAAGCQVIKSEILHDADVCFSPAGMNVTYHHASGSITEKYRSLIEKKIVPLEQYERIIRYVKQKNLPFVASAYDIAGIDFLAKQKADGIKLWRNNYNNFPLIRHAAKSGLPIIFDAAGIYLHELVRAVNFAFAEGARGVIVNHHPGKNPTPASEHNLRVIATYKREMNIPIGLSCHYRGEEIIYAAIGAGANIIEKGIIEDADIAEQNVVSALPVSELKRVVQLVENCSNALGKPEIQIKEPRDHSLEYGLVAFRSIAAGESLTLDNVRFAFPVVGLHVQHWDRVAGKKAKKNIEQGTPVFEEDINLDS